MVGATATRTGKPAGVILEEFGTAVVPTLLQLYGAFVDPDWRTLDLPMNTESVIHRAIRLNAPEAKPPRLLPQRVSEQEVHIEYSSARRLCALAIGICRGVAAHYEETITIEQPDCVERGSSVCRLVVRLASS